MGLAWKETCGRLISNHSCAFQCIALSLGICITWLLMDLKLKIYQLHKKWDGMNSVVVWPVKQAPRKHLKCVYQTSHAEVCSLSTHPIPSQMLKKKISIAKNLNDSNDHTPPRQPWDRPFEHQHSQADCAVENIAALCTGQIAFSGDLSLQAMSAM